MRISQDDWLINVKTVRFLNAQKLENHIFILQINSK